MQIEEGVIHRGLITPILGQIIVLNLTNVHKLAAYTVLACIRKNKNIKYNNNYSGLTFKMQPLKSIK